MRHKLCAACGQPIQKIDYGEADVYRCGECREETWVESASNARRVVACEACGNVKEMTYSRTEAVIRDVVGPGLCESCLVLESLAPGEAAALEALFRESFEDGDLVCRCKQCGSIFSVDGQSPPALEFASAHPEATDGFHFTAGIAVPECPACSERSC